MNACLRILTSTTIKITRYDGNGVTLYLREAFVVVVKEGFFITIVRNIIR